MSDEGLSRRQYLTTVGGSAVAFSVAGCMGDGGSGGSGGSEPTITAGTAPGFPPFEMKEGGDLVGFDVDLLEAVVEETDYSFEGWEEFEFDSLIPALNNDNIDVIAAAMTITDDRDENIDFSDPYYSADQSIIVRADGDFSPGSLDDLSDRPIGAQKGTTGEGVVNEELVGSRITEGQYNAYDNYVLAVQDLENGNIDAVVLDQPVAETFAANRPVSVAFVYETGERYGFGIREGDSDRQSALNDGLSTVRENGTYEELTQTWFGE
ncbi:basic amino acid ABC transporter substrate-binding protein [Haloarcula halophila]|uniref:basic amino acid ABC transporter substrate-binding protein n=1 Tax=Haloarcula TaxID=2237 RepID=UPI0023E477EE|nr:basic amino acid ABC transporter substrate-binding protein [Halomicroarcula sp. DFY41]